MAGPGLPRAERLGLPPEYGAPSRVLAWADVAARLEQAPRYWLATVRPDGRPHTVPVDGIWLDIDWYFGGSAGAVKHRNLLGNPQVSVHLEDAGAAVIVEGSCAWVDIDIRTARRLAAASQAKYGYAPPVYAYRAGTWRLQPVRVLAWTDLTSDATRFVFS